MNIEIRSLFPVTREKVYLDTAYISPTPSSVLQAAAGYERMRSLGEAGRTDEWSQLMEDCKTRFARLLHIEPHQVALTTNTSEGTNIVANMLDLQPGDNIIWDELDHPSNKLIWINQGKRRGIENRIISAVDGRVPLPAYEKVVDRNTRVISISLVAHNNGFLYDFEGLANLAHANGAYLHVDAIQSVGAIDLDLSRSGIDFLTCGTYKWLCGPQGLAFFYIREALFDRFTPLYSGWLQMKNWMQGMDPLQIELHADARKFQTATLDPRAMTELAAALDLILRVGVDNIEAHNLLMAGRLWAGLDQAGFEVVTPPGTRSSIVSCRFDNSASIGEFLQQNGCIATARGSLLRFAPHFFNTEEDIQKALALLQLYRMQQ